MQKYIIIAFVITTMLGYIGWLKYDNVKLQTTISNLESKNKGLETSLNIPFTEVLGNLVSLNSVIIHHR